ncbi:NAD(P)/FAD-dependent oxidoreductase [Desulfonatronum thioautotrophicum]|uniref:NAD(P)/FAD-dependent oxidoreductase n=1 Tax=Desulfonatronum thioautotrophicum TaxID=617001 RepID=UPI0005EB4403|nr:FAD-dependent oxidoreductase [Desulfonatronum thioautotrophicum]
MTRHKIAVVGAGAAGIVAAHYLSRVHEVLLFEAAPQLGGHVQTFMVPDTHPDTAPNIATDTAPDTAGDGKSNTLPVDMGFIVFNDRTYPNFRRFIAELGVQAAATEMSFSYSEPASGFAYAGTSLSGLFARRANLIDPAFWRMLLALRRFCRTITQDLEQNRLGEETLGAYLQAGSYPNILFRRYLEPMVRAIWSAESRDARTFPIRRFARFFANHGLLSIRGGPQWLYLPGGSHTYVQAFARAFSGTVHLNSPVQAVTRTEHGATLRVNGSECTVDAVVLACHADTTLSLLTDADDQERECLSPWRYVANDVVLHTDATFLPPNRKAWACWNVIADTAATAPHMPSDDRVHVHYWMNRLQNLAAQNTHVVTLNPRRPIPQGHENHRMELHHPQFSLQALRMQSHFPELQGRRGTYFCGSYHGNGFHEDAAASGVRVAQALGIEA